MAVLGAFCNGTFCVRAPVDNLRSNILKDRKLRQQVNDSAGVVHHPPVALRETPRSPVFKRSKEQPIPSAPDNPKIVTYMHKWQVADYPISIMLYLISRSSSQRDLTNIDVYLRTVLSVPPLMD